MNKIALFLVPGNSFCSPTTIKPLNLQNSHFLTLKRHKKVFLLVTFYYHHSKSSKPTITPSLSSTLFSAIYTSVPIKINILRTSLLKLSCALQIVIKLRVTSTTVNYHHRKSLFLPPPLQLPPPHSDNNKQPQQRNFIPFY